MLVLELDPRYHGVHCWNHCNSYQHYPATLLPKKSMKEKININTSNHYHHQFPTLTSNEKHHVSGGLGYTDYHGNFIMTDPRPLDPIGEHQWNVRWGPYILVGLCIYVVIGIPVFVIGVITIGNAVVADDD